MLDELFNIIQNYKMDYIIEFEKYLIPKYSKEIFELYRESCLIEADNARNRKAYSNLASNVKHIIYMENSTEVVTSLLKEIKEKHFRSRPAMEDEFYRHISNLDEYIK